MSGTVSPVQSKPRSSKARDPRTVELSARPDGTLGALSSKRRGYLHRAPRRRWLAVPVPGLPEARDVLPQHRRCLHPRLRLVRHGKRSSLRG
jgi:hypothetical protein